MTDTKSGPPSYKVGYSQPPVEHRFRKGVSGNPKGRGKGTKNFATIFMTAMTKSVTITENGTQEDFEARCLTFVHIPPGPEGSSARS